MRPPGGVLKVFSFGARGANPSRLPPDSVLGGPRAPCATSMNKGCPDRTGPVFGPVSRVNLGEFGRTRGNERELK